MDTALQPRTIFLLIVVATMLWAAWRQWRILRISRSTARFESTEGQITSSRVVHIPAAMGSTAQVQAPQIVYGYEVDGCRYQGERLSFDPMTWTTFAARAERVCARYPVGLRVQVLYDPECPERACLERTDGVSASALLQVLAPIAAAIGAFAWLLLG